MGTDFSIKAVSAAPVVALTQPASEAPKDAVATELIDRRGVGLNPWLEERYRAFRLEDSRDDAHVNQAISPEAGKEATRG